MFTTLLESRAGRTRRTGGTAASMLVHGALITSAVAVSVPSHGAATLIHDPDRAVVYVAPHPAQPQMPRPTAPGPTQPALPSIPMIPAPNYTPIGIPPVEVGQMTLPDDFVIGTRIGDLVGRPSPPVAGDGIVNVEMVERVPRVLGTPPTPRYPDALRSSGVTGSVTMRFVVDTTGRAELDGVQVIEATHGLFADAARRALAGFRFSPGEVGGRKVRTMVQLPFTFTIR